MLGVADQILGKKAQRQRYDAGSRRETTLESTPIGGGRAEQREKPS